MRFLAMCLFCSLFIISCGNRKIVEKTASSFEEAFADPKGLKVINVKEYLLTSLPTGIGKLKSVEIINIDNAPNLKVIPDSIGKMKNLKLLRIVGSKITELPSSMQQLQKLKIVNLSSSEMENIPLVLSQIPHLKSLLLYDTKIQYLPDEFLEKSAITGLHLENNKKLVSLPRDINKLASLSIKNSPLLVELPKGTNSMYLMSTIIIQNTGLKNLPDPFICPNLWELYINETNLENLPKGIFYSEKLSIINLANNKIETIYDDIKINHWVVDLDLSNNFLSELPGTIGNFKNLYTLNASSNKLEYFPSEFFKAKNLNMVDLSGNMLEDFDLELFAKSNIQILNVQKNPLNKDIKKQIKEADLHKRIVF